jgi:hypothetical protein
VVYMYDVYMYVYDDFGGKDDDDDDKLYARNL